MAIQSLFFLFRRFIMATSTTLSAKHFITHLSQALNDGDFSTLRETLQSCPQEVVPKPDLSKVPPSLLAMPIGIGHTKDQPDILASDNVLSFLAVVASSIDGKEEMSDESLSSFIQETALSSPDVDALEVSVARPKGGWTKGHLMITLQKVNFLTFSARQRATRVSPENAFVCVRHGGMPYFSTDLKTGPVVSKVFASFWVDLIDGHYVVNGVGTAYANETGTKPCVHWCPLSRIPKEDAVAEFIPKASDWIKKVEDEGVWALSSL